MKRASGQHLHHSAAAFAGDEDVEDSPARVGAARLLVLGGKIKRMPKPRPLRFQLSKLVLRPRCHASSPLRRLLVEDDQSSSGHAGAVAPAAGRLIIMKRFQVSSLVLDNFNLKLRCENRHRKMFAEIQAFRTCLAMTGLMTPSLQSIVSFRIESECMCLSPHNLPQLRCTCT